MPFVKGQKPPKRGEQMEQERPDRTAEVNRSSRPKRKPLGQRNRLTFDNLDPNYVYRVINDKDDRLQRAQEGGYEFVTSDKSLGDKDALDASKLGSHVAKPVGGGTVGYLMRIPREYYDEDQALKSQRLNETEASMKPKKEKGEYGEGLIRS